MTLHMIDSPLQCPATSRCPRISANAFQGSYSMCKKQGLSSDGRRSLPHFTIACDHIVSTTSTSRRSESLHWWKPGMRGSISSWRSGPTGRRNGLTCTLAVASRPACMPTQSLWRRSSSKGGETHALSTPCHVIGTSSTRLLAADQIATAHGSQTAAAMHMHRACSRHDPPHLLAPRWSCATASCMITCPVNPDLRHLCLPSRPSSPRWARLQPGRTDRSGAFHHTPPFRANKKTNKQKSLRPRDIKSSGDTPWCLVYGAGIHVRALMYAATHIRSLQLAAPSRTEQDRPTPSAHGAHERDLWRCPTPRLSHVQDTPETTCMLPTADTAAPPPPQERMASPSLVRTWSPHSWAGPWHSLQAAWTACMLQPRAWRRWGPGCTCTAALCLQVRVQHARHWRALALQQRAR